MADCPRVTDRFGSPEPEDWGPEGPPDGADDYDMCSWVRDDGMTCSDPATIGRPDGEDVCAYHKANPSTETPKSTAASSTGRADRPSPAGG